MSDEWKQIADGLAAALEGCDADIWQVHGEFHTIISGCDCEDRALAVIEALAAYDQLNGVRRPEAE